MAETNRRKFLKRGASIAALTATAAAAQEPDRPAKRVIYRNGKKPDKPLFSSTVAYGNLLFISGVGYHQEGDIKVHTEHVLQSIQEQLESAGSSMEKVLKCNVYLADLKDYAGMNAVFLGKFGPEPPVRTTVAVSGVPGNSLVEIDVIAYL